MNQYVRSFSTLAFSILIASAGFAVDPQSKPLSASKTAARGEYLVKKVAMCGDCHSPRNEKGEFIEDKWLQGQALPFRATIPIPWAERAPNIAGLKGVPDSMAIRLLMGEKVVKLRAPMPEYAMSKEDAAAVVAYLRSLAPQPAATTSAKTSSKK